MGLLLLVGLLAVSACLAVDEDLEERSRLAHGTHPGRCLPDHYQPVADGHLDLGYLLVEGPLAVDGYLPVGRLVDGGHPDVQAPLAVSERRLLEDLLADVVLLVVERVLAVFEVERPVLADVLGFRAQQHLVPQAMLEIGPIGAHRHGVHLPPCFFQVVLSLGLELVRIGSPVQRLSLYIERREKKQAYRPPRAQ